MVHIYAGLTPLHAEALPAEGTPTESGAFGLPKSELLRDSVRTNTYFYITLIEARAIGSNIRTPFRHPLSPKTSPPPWKETQMEYQTPSLTDMLPVIVQWLTDANVVAYEDWGHYDARYTYQLGDRPHHVPRARMRDAVKRCALHYMDTQAADPTARNRAVCERAAAAIRADEEGTVRYIRHLTDLVVDELPVVEDRPLLVTTRRTYQRTPEYRRDYKARRSAADRERTRTGIEKWLRLLPAGRHDIADLWARWQREVLTTQTARVPEFGRVGRNDWYNLLADVTPVHTGGGHRRYVVLHETTPASTIEA